MLSIAKITSSGAGYLAKDNYYVKGEAEAGQWFGKGAERLGLEGGVDNVQFDEMLKGRFGGSELGRVRDGKLDHHPGWDHTFSAPKSVSLLALLAHDKRFIEAHDKAVDFALGHIEKNLIGSRFRTGEQLEFQKTQNMVAAKYRHDISRNKDPQLHTHAAILNVTFGHNDTLRSLDSPIFYENKMLIGAMYQSKLADLVVELGCKININENGTFDIKDVDRELIDKASKRRNDIVEDMKEKGQSGAVAAQHSSLATRSQKEELSYKEKTDLWKQDFGDKAINELVDYSKNLKPKSLANDQIKQRELAAIEAVESAIKHLSENEAVFKAIDLEREAIVSALGKTDSELIKNVINSKVESAELLHAKTKEIIILNDNPKTLNKRAYTTPELIAKERKTLKIMREERQRVEPITNNTDNLKRKNELTNGQLNAVKTILTTSDRFVNIQGLAGTGKTFMLAEVKDQVEARNYKIVGLAPSGAAANILRDDIGIEAKTIHSFLKQGLQDLHIKNNAPQNPLNSKLAEPPQKEIWLIDESSLISTTQALAISQLATKRDARVVLLGDKSQLGGVEAGKPFAISQHKKYGLQTVEMNEIVRQTDIGLQQAVYSATKGDVAGAFKQLKSNIIEVQDKNGEDKPVLRREIIANTYLSMPQEKQDKTLILVPANEDRDSINNYVREGLIQDGILGKKAISTTNLINRNLTTEAKTKSFNYFKDNIVLFSRGYKRLDINRGEYFSVKSINHDLNQITLLSSKDKEVVWNPKKVGSKNSEIYTEQSREIRKGEVLFWRRAKTSSKDNRHTNEKIKVLSINSPKNIVNYVDVITGEAKSMRLDDLSNKHWEHAYCLTAHQSQGQTAETVLINLESWRTKLSNQQAFYVELSRAKEQAIVFTDDRDKITRQLLTTTGEKQSSLEQSSDPRALNVEDILAKKQGKATKDELRAKEKLQLKAIANNYIKNLNPKEKGALEEEYRSTQSRTILKMYDNSKSEEIKSNYQDQIRLHVEQKLGKEKLNNKDSNRNMGIKQQAEIGR